MIEADVTAMVRGVIVDRGLPFVVLSVAPVPAGWNIRVRANHSGTVVTIAIPDGRPSAMRVAIEERLEAAD